MAAAAPGLFLSRAKEQSVRYVENYKKCLRSVSKTCALNKCCREADSLSSLPIVTNFKFAQSRPCGCGSPLIRTEVMSYPEKQALQAWRKAKKNDYQVIITLKKFVKRLQVLTISHKEEDNKFFIFNQ